MYYIYIYHVIYIYISYIIYLSIWLCLCVLETSVIIIHLCECSLLEKMSCFFKKKREIFSASQQLRFQLMRNVSGLPGRLGVLLSRIPRNLPGTAVTKGYQGLGHLLIGLGPLGISRNWRGCTGCFSHETPDISECCRHVPWAEAKA